jgi:DNA (cytosine-5)-methyltransferase 1
MTRPTALSLFSGVGGLDAAVEAHGFTVVAQVENDPYCQAILERHWPGVPRYGDIKEIDWHAYLATHGRPDLVAAGFPCQPVSAAGRRKAQADPRWLWPEVARCVRVLRPGYVFLENTLGLLSRGFGDVLGDLAALGFDAEGDCFQAADVGAPHQRDRVFVLAYAPWAGRGRPRVGVVAGGAGLAYANGEGQPQPAWSVAESWGRAGNGSGDVADSGGARRRQDPRGAPGDEGQDAGRAAPCDHQPDGGHQGDGAGHVADADGTGRQQRTGARRNGRGQPGSAHNGHVDDSAVVGGEPDGRQQQPQDGDPRRQLHLGQSQPRVGGGASRLPGGLDGHRWPAPPGPPHPWEPPRTVPARTVPSRGKRLKALGNAVVPQQGTLAFGVLWRRMLDGAA